MVIYVLLIHVIEIPRFWLKSRGLFEHPFLKMVLKRLQLSVSILDDAFSHKFGILQEIKYFDHIKKIIS